VFESLKNEGSVFSSVFGYQGAGPVHLAVDGRADEVDAELVSGNYFQGLGVFPLAGRLIAEEDDHPASAVAVINFALSKTFFDDPSRAVGRSIRINNVPFTLIGVTPEGFFGADPGANPGVYIPLWATVLLEEARGRRSNEPPPSAKFADHGYDWVVPMARLQPGITAAQAQARLSGPFLNWDAPAKRTPDKLRTLIVKEAPGGLDGLRRQYSDPLYMLLVLVALILAIACANIANLQMARAAARTREIAVRLSIGAARARVIRQLLTESILLALAGGIAGVVVAWWGIRFLTLLLSNGGGRLCPSSAELAGARSRLASLAGHRRFVRACSRNPVDACRSYSRLEDDSRPRCSFAFFLRPEASARTGGFANRHDAGDPGGGGTFSANVLEAGVHPAWIQSGQRADFQRERASGGARGPGDHSVLPGPSVAVR
jgi:hypothetical protein